MVDFKYKGWDLIWMPHKYWWFLNLINETSSISKMHKRCQSKITIEESWYITCYASKYRRQHRKVKKYKKKKCNETSFFYGWGPFCQQKCSFTDQEHSAAVHLLGRLLVFSLGIVSQSQRLKTPLFPCLILWTVHDDFLSLSSILIKWAI